MTDQNTAQSTNPEAGDEAVNGTAAPAGAEQQAASEQSGEKGAAEEKKAGASVRLGFVYNILNALGKIPGLSFLKPMASKAYDAQLAAMNVEKAKKEAGKLSGKK